MTSPLKNILKPILESIEGIHLTAYLVNNGDIDNLKSQLQEIVWEAESNLYLVKSIEERKKFLEPIYGLLNDAGILINMKNSIGIFRNQNSFRILNIPIALDRQCHIADTFHVKPLLKWMQFDRQFLVLEIKKRSVQISIGTSTTFKKVGEVHSEAHNQLIGTLAKWLDDNICMSQSSSSVNAFVYSRKPLPKELLNILKTRNFFIWNLTKNESIRSISETLEFGRKVLLEEAKRNLSRKIIEFEFADRRNLAKKNIFQIAKAAIHGRVKKLLIADGINIFGRINRKTGGLAIHPVDLNHEDDDILDDIAQAVLATGGEVVVAPKTEMPSNRPVMAILSEENIGTKLLKVKFKEVSL